MDEASSNNNDVGSMSAGRITKDPNLRHVPRVERDGFSLISKQPIHYDINLTQKFQFVDILYEKSTQDQCSRIRINRPRIMNAFRPRTVREMQVALEDSTNDPNIAAIILTGTASATLEEGNNNSKTTTPATAFCIGGDQNVRSDGGGYYDETESQPKLRVLDLQVQIRRCPKPVVAVVRGYALGGGHVLHMVCDLTLASNNAVFGQTGPRMGSFDAGYGCSQAAALMGQKRARELWMLARFYDANQALQMGLINAIYDDHELESNVAQWIRRINMNSPTALAACKASLNAVQDGSAGLSQLGGELTRLFYLSKESQEGRNAFFEKRPPQFRTSKL